MLDRRVLQHKIAARLDLEEIAATRELIERGQIAGNVVMRVGSLDNNICLQLRGKSSNPTKAKQKLVRVPDQLLTNVS